jgi:hypothetical protein
VGVTVDGALAVDVVDMVDDLVEMKSARRT